MKIISFNTWAGRNMWSLTRFLRRMRDDVDVFCFQEIHNALRDEVDARHPDEFVRGDVMQLIAAQLPGHVGVFANHSDDPIRMSNAMFIRRNIGGVQVSNRTVYEPNEPKEHGSFVLSARKLQWAVIDSTVHSKVWIGNMHGLWTPDGKQDSSERIKQSENILRIADSWQGPKVLMGDFNIHPNTESWRMLFRAFDDELVMKRCTSTTRTPLYRHFGDADLDGPIDFCFVSGVQVNEFRVMPDVVSDHAPLYLEIE